jgi:superfamily I DNA and/or RNA helicase
MADFKKLLSCWHKLEHFSPASLPKGKNVVELKIPEPWYATTSPPASKNKTIEYTIYIGVFESSIVTEFVNNYYENRTKDENQKSSKILYASLKLDIKGNYIEKSIGVSTLPWALSQLEKGHINTNNWSNKFEKIIENLSNDFDYIFNETEIGEEGEILRDRTPLGLAKLKEIQVRIEALCGWSISPEKRIYVKRDEKYISKKIIETDNSNTDLLNSFYIKDLESIFSKCHSNNSPTAFSNYLDGCLNNKSNRIDLSTEVDVLKLSLSPKNFPDGCWPSTYTISLMQQFAVNSIFNNLASSNQEGMFSVNGPPGTGKTTLLRDIIAPILVKRAKILSKIKNPADAFTKVGKINITEKFTPFVYAPDNELTNSGIVVTSSNNGAVENISKELPLKAEVSSYRDKVAYFKDVAENCVSEENWGLISAVLGNKRNRNTLVNTLWFNESKDFNDLRKTLKFNKVDNIEWAEIVLKFKDKLAEVAIEKGRLENYKNEYVEFEEVFRVKNQLDNELKKYSKDFQKHKQESKNLQLLLEKIKNEKKELLAELVIIKENKPNIFVYWFNRPIRNEYKKSIKSILYHYNRASKSFKDEKLRANDITLRIRKQKKNLIHCRKVVSSQSKKLSVLEDKTKEAKYELKNNYADIDFWKNIETKKSQESCPWYSDKLKKLQCELFIISLKVNELFILNANSKSSRISTTLAGFFEYLKGGVKVSKQEAKAMWDTFFLVIPVVSSTFASIQSMFKDLDKGDIPWLFIDEAGQAVPQAAVGAIWRSKRVAVVGDPFQIEPVVTIDNTITNNSSFGVDEQTTKKTINNLK